MWCSLCGAQDSRVTTLQYRVKNDVNLTGIPDLLWLDVPVYDAKPMEPLEQLDHFERQVYTNRDGQPA